MKFDVFHSIGRIDSITPLLTDRSVFEGFIDQALWAETLGYQTVWVAESHFSSEVQKRHSEAVIPHYQGEVGLNADSLQLANFIFARTQRIGFGTAILNIVGGNGGPIAAADRIRSLAWLNSLRDTPRPLHIGVASGRFPYINKPFGIKPRSAAERILWPQYQQLIFLEALEIFLRLVNDETISSDDVTRYQITPALFKDEAIWASVRERLAECEPAGDWDHLTYKPRWEFDALKLVPSFAPSEWGGFMNFVLGSSDPLARDLALRFADVDIFNLSFTPPDKLNQVHAEMFERYKGAGRTWSRSRMPRTVLVFIGKDAARAQDRASRCFDTYIEAMRGTAALPPKDVLMQRALIGTSEMIRQQLSPNDPHGFHQDDRLMLWFEFNQTDHTAIKAQMRQFAEEVMPHFS